MKILITAGPTREYIDDVRFLSNASSGRMGYSLAAAALARGHQVDLVTGPVEQSAPAGCTVHRIETTDQLRQRCLELFPQCDGVIATAAVCDYRPKERITGKITRPAIRLLLSSQKRRMCWQSLVVKRAIAGSLALPSSRRILATMRCENCE